MTDFFQVPQMLLAKGSLSLLKTALKSKQPSDTLSG
jgi:hypothetical protein